MKPLKIKFKFNPLVVIAMTLFLTLPLSVMAEEGRIINILSSEENTNTGILIKPSELTIEPGIIVIWVNAIKGDEVNILFNDGKTTEDATDDPMGFDLDKKGEYAAKYMPFAATTSLRFIKKGNYPFKIVSQNTKLMTRGTIIVP